MAIYIQHICKNKECDRIFLDKEPFYGCQGVQKWKYCPECEKNGFVSPDYKSVRKKRLNK